MPATNVNEEAYLALLNTVLHHGHVKGDRTGTGTYSMFGRHLHQDLTRGFPLLTTKRVNYKAVFAELCWILRGETNVNELYDEDGKHVGIWDAWARPNGDLGPVYGKQWRCFEGFEWGGMTSGLGDPTRVDQLADLERRLHDDPDDRRMMVSAWHPGDVPAMKLPPCHLLFQVYTRADEDGHRYLSLQVYQRSADLFLGVPFNIASYAALAHLLAYRAGMTPEWLVFSFGDAHVYRNHEEAVLEQLGRTPKKAPTLSLTTAALTEPSRKGSGIGVRTAQAPLERVARDPGIFRINGYDPHPAIPAPVAV